MACISHYIVQSVVKIMIRVFKKDHISFGTVTVPLVVEFFKNIDFQRRYENFSDTPVPLFMLHSVSNTSRWNFRA